ncbi:hypothetical protein BKA56DRAFT_665436 [Ilyonectria sp. MPI-CAGE-AT-0026]|nr:hypothetical protein BKA56DRAFT_665436 [Ilyonectria sp. MPI-CAGE-AT-0026]
MDPPTTIDMDQMIMGVDLTMDNGPWVEGNLSMTSRYNYFSCGLLQGWLDTPFDGFDPEIPLQDNTKLYTSPQTNQFNNALLTTTSHDSSPNTLNDAIAELDAMEFFTTNNSTSTESATLSPESLWLGGSLTTESSASSVRGVPFAQLDDFYLSGTSLSPAPIADLQNYPQSGNSSNDQVTLVSKKTRSRPCDMRRQRKKDERPELCKFCPKGFGFGRDLKRHIIAKHKHEAKTMGLSVEKFRCKHPSCTKTFSREDNLTRHLKNHHVT